MILLGHCPDRTGLVSKISGFFEEKNLNILQLEEHTERGEFFLRVHAQGNNSKAEISEFSQDFDSLAKSLNFSFETFSDTQKTKIVLFCSDTLPTPLEVIMSEISGSLPVQVVHIISNKKEIEPIAQQMNIPYSYIKSISGNFEHENSQLEILKTLEFDAIVLARYMKIISSEFLSEISQPIINIHHSFLPSFIGGKPYEMAFERGVKLIGATSHFVTKDLDEGPIIAQDVLHIGHRLSLDEIKKEGANVEKKVLLSALKKFSQHKVIEWKGRTVVFD